MIAGVLLLLVMGVAAQLTQMAYSTFVKSTKTSEIFRKQSLATDLLSRELRLCTEVMTPGKVYGVAYYPGAQDDALVFKRYSPSLGKETVVSYRFDPDERVIVRESFESHYDPRRPSSQTINENRSPKVVATEVEEFVFQALAPEQHYGAFMLTFQIVVKTGESTSRVGSTVRIRSL